MQRRQPLPRLWMMTDERQGDALLPAFARLPQAAGIVFRHYSLAERERRALFDTVRQAAGDRILMLAGPPQLARHWGAGGSHGWEGVAGADLLRSASVHDASEMEAANRLGLDLVFVSPVFATRSHPDRRPLGAEGLRQISGKAAMPVIALGGMNGDRARKLGPGTIYGWAAIDAWSGA